MSHNTYTLNNDGADAGSYHGAQNGFIYLGRGETATYPKAFTHLDFIEFYDTNPINTINGASLVAGTSANWYNGFTVPAGTYYVEASQHLKNSATGIYSCNCIGSALDGTNIKDFAFHSPSNNMSANFWGQWPRNTVYATTLSTSATMRFKFVLIHSNQTDTPIRLSETQFLLIRKIA